MKVLFALISDGTGLCFHNDQTFIEGDYIYEDSTGYGSKNYAAIKGFNIEEVRLKYRP